VTNRPASSICLCGGDLASRWCAHSARVGGCVGEILPPLWHWWIRLRPNFLRPSLPNDFCRNDTRVKTRCQPSWSSLPYSPATNFRAWILAQNPYTASKFFSRYESGLLARDENFAIADLTCAGGVTLSTTIST